jgi:predicted signal transduction protein with EAL and GGDEF domain/FixJ family two-component response regulator
VVVSLLAQVVDAQREGHAAARGRLLLVDDDPVNRLLTQRALHERGFDVDVVDSGEAAIEATASQGYDIVLLDALMPGLDGFETCTRIRAQRGLESIPVLMLTGLDDDHSIAQAFEAGATDFFVKSPRWALLAGRLRYMLRAAQTRSELERSRAKLAWAQELARMGSFDWAWGTGLVLSVEGLLRVFGNLGGMRGRAPWAQLRQLLRCVAPDSRSEFVPQLRSALRSETPLACDVTMVGADAKPRIVHVEAEPQFDDRGSACAYTGVVQDVTDRRRVEDRIRHLANFDSLTGLPNRRQLIWRLERSLDRARRSGARVALLLIDLDRFKVINDTLGHSAGDELLMEVAKRLRNCVRHCDHPGEGHHGLPGVRGLSSFEAMARLGGDEFVALLPDDPSEDDAHRVARRIIDSLHQPIVVQDQECFVTASVGIALYPRDGAEVADLLRHADAAMYAAKAGGRNALAMYSPHLSLRGRERLELETALHKAIEREELVLHYQPKVDVATGRMVGAEALMRWQRGNALVPPGDFIPLAEETGLILPMSEWAVREAARQAKIWTLGFGFAESIAVNLPTRLFERSDLIERIHDAVTHYGVPHSAIQLEITETGLMKDMQTVIPSLHRLNGLGVEISIDDFGTGYSSLAYLTSLPISELKIDRSFVRDLGITPQSLAVVNAIVALAHSLKLRVIAEGVETERQIHELSHLGCTLMQGYHFSRPVPGDDLERWMLDVVLPRRAPWMQAAEAKDKASVVLPLRSGAKTV